MFCYGYEIRCDISYYMGVVKNVSSRGSLVSPDRAMCVRSHALPTRECAPAPRRPVVRTGTCACVREPLLPGTRRDALFNCVTCVRVVYYIPLQYYYFNDMCVSSPFNLYCTSWWRACVCEPLVWMLGRLISARDIVQRPITLLVRLYCTYCLYSCIDTVTDVRWS